MSPAKKLDVIGTVRANELCIGNDCRTSWPVSGSQLNVITLTASGNITSSDSIKAAGNLIIGLETPVIETISSLSQTGGSLTSPTQYCYRVSAVNSAGETKASPVQCITTQAGHNTVTIQWQQIGSATSYRVYGRTSQLGLLASITAINFTDNGASVQGNPALEFSGNGKLDVMGNATVEKLCLGGVCKSQWDAINNNLVIESRTSDPASPQTGQIWIRTDIP